MFDLIKNIFDFTFQLICFFLFYGVATLLSLVILSIFPLVISGIVFYALSFILSNKLSLFLSSVVFVFSDLGTIFAVEEKYDPDIFDTMFAKANTLMEKLF